LLPSRLRIARLLPLLGLAAADLLPAQSLERILPRGARRGTEATFTFRGRRLDGPEDILFYEPGVTLLGFDGAKPNEVSVRVKIAEDCRLGEHALRLRTRGGLSELRTFYVGALDEAAESEPNGDFVAPQRIPLNVTVSGVVKGEDVDYYAFEAKKGERVTAEVEAMRLGTAVFDPYVAILNAGRFELASSDDATLLGQDAVASAIIPEDGVYVVEVRECAYGGNDDSLYRLHLGTFPRPLAVYPPGGKAGEELEVAFLGDASGEIRKRVALPAGPREGFYLFAEDPGGVAPSANPFRVSAFGNALEAEPNDTRETATPAEPSRALNGILARPGDVDHFRVPLKKGQALDVHVWGRRIRSPIDSVLAILDPEGKTLASNDDAVGPDSYLRFTAPEDKEYTILIADHLGKGGPLNVYRVELAPVEPRVVLGFPRVRQNSQERQTVEVPRGNRCALLVAANRIDSGGDLTLALDGLPAGVSASAEILPGDLGAVPVVFEAAADAPVGGGFFSLAARPADPAASLRSEFLQDVDLIVGGPGQSVYWKYAADRPAIAVIDEAPFRLSIVEPKVPIVQNGNLSLRVVAERREGFKAPIRLEMPFQPPGVSAAGGVQIAEGATEAAIPLTANGRAATRAWKVVASGVAETERGRVWVSSQLAALEVAAPFFTLKLDRAAVEQGKETAILCTVEQKAPFEGAARLELVGLPPKVSALPLEATRETTELTIRVAADAESPPGQHKNIFCRVELMRDGEPIAYGSGSTELRIDPPPPPKKDDPPKPAEAAPEKPPDPKPEPTPPAERPLTRLEKLRLEARDRLEGEKEAK
jgi:hypothetical protein